MVVDTSALVAILLEEPEAETFRTAIADADEPVVSAVAVVEFGMVALGRRGFAPDEVEGRLREWGLTVQPVTPSDARLALDAFARYGKGRHSAGLNFGDCFAYALAKERGEPLLFKGDDFSQTDITPAF
jgi:ribonuclease VapC